MNFKKILKIKKENCVYLILFIIVLLSIGVLIYRFHFSGYQIEGYTVEGFTLNEGFTNNIISHNTGIYDKFYSRIYDKIFTDIKKSSLELTNIIEYTIKRVEDPYPKDSIKFLDAGCGTGITASIIGKLYPVTCLDKSNDMLEIAKTRQSEGMKLLQGDIQNRSMFSANSFTHILCLYFTMYYFQDINHIFENFSKWIKPNGFVVLHLVDKKAFDPVANPSSPFILSDPQAHIDKRKTDSLIVFNNFTYESNFKMLSKDKAIFEETFKYKDPSKKPRKQQHVFYMYDKAKYVSVAERYGFALEKIEPQTFSGYGHHYLFIFRKVKDERIVSRLKSQAIYKKK